jgi:hypothetical protein
MPDIRYICVSDLHLGADNSLLTQLGPDPGDVDPSKPSEVLVEFAGCLRELVRHNESPVKPTLILNGDALELALTQDNIALMAFERFLELMFPINGEALIAPQIIFNPGNHDHHLWETARETQYVEFLRGKRSKKPGIDLPPPWHATNMFDPDLLDSCLLNAVISRHAHMTARKVCVGTVYPNLCLLNAGESNCVIFSHGHFVESIYMLMTTLGNFVFPNRVVPKQVWDIETENFAWIDFFWSAMGRSGEVGKDIEHVYDMLLVPKASNRLMRQLARAVGHRSVRWAPKLGEWLGLLSVPFVSRLVGKAGGLEKMQIGQSLTPDAAQGLRAYVGGLLANQIQEERKRPMPAKITFTFGHTHKPFSAAMDFDHFPNGMSVYNSGGWVVDTKDTDPTHGGAIILVDEQMNAVSVRMYNEARRATAQHVRLEAVDGPANPLRNRLAGLINSNQEPWLSFSRVVADNVDAYHANFRKRLKLARI